MKDDIERQPQEIKAETRPVAPVEGERPPLTQRVERLRELDARLGEDDPEAAAQQATEARQHVAERYQQELAEVTAVIGTEPNAESLALVQEKQDEETAAADHGGPERMAAEGERAELLAENREERLADIGQEAAAYGDLQALMDKGWGGRREILADPEKAKRFVEYKKLLAEKMKLEILPQLEKDLPGLEYFVTRDVATEMPAENSTQVLIAVVEPSPEQDPHHRLREEIAKKLISLGLTNSVALGEKFSGNSERHQAFLDFVFIHKGKDGKYQSQRPEHEIVSEAEREVAIGKKLPEHWDKAGTFREMSPADFDPPPSYPDHFRDDIIYNGIYLRGPEMARKLDVFTRRGELTAAQRELVNRKVMEEGHFFTPEQARRIKETRRDDLRQAAKFGRQYFGRDLFDEKTLAELQQEEADSLDFSNVLGQGSETEIGERVDAAALRPERIPAIEGLPPDKAQAIFGELVKRSMFGHAGRDGKMPKNELFAYPAEVQTDVPILLLANQPRLIEATKEVEEAIRAQGGQPDRRAIHAQLVEFMKNVIADFKGKKTEEYWKDHDQYEVLRPGFEE